jgi:hypothetical protein
MFDSRDQQHEAPKDDVTAAAVARQAQREAEAHAAYHHALVVAALKTDADRAEAVDRICVCLERLGRIDRVQQWVDNDMTWVRRTVERFQVAATLESASREAVAYPKSADVARDLRRAHDALQELGRLQRERPGLFAEIESILGPATLPKTKTADQKAGADYRKKYSDMHRIECDAIRRRVQSDVARGFPGSDEREIEQTATSNLEQMGYKRPPALAVASAEMEPTAAAHPATAVSA